MKIFYENKWDQTKLSNVKNKVLSQLVDQKKRISVWLPDGRCVGERIIKEFEDPTDIVVLESWVGGRLELHDQYIVRSMRDNEFYIIEPEYSLYVSYWATISNYLYDEFVFCELYDSYEKLIAAINDIQKGNQPYTIKSRIRLHE